MRRSAVRHGESCVCQTPLPLISAKSNRAVSMCDVETPWRPAGDGSPLVRVSRSELPSSLELPCVQIIWWVHDLVHLLRRCAPTRQFPRGIDIGKQRREKDCQHSKQGKHRLCRGRKCIARLLFALRKTESPILSFSSWCHELDSRCPRYHHEISRYLADDDPCHCLSQDPSSTTTGDKLKKPQSKCPLIALPHDALRPSTPSAHIHVSLASSLILSAREGKGLFARPERVNRVEMRDRNCCVYDLRVCTATS